MVKVEGLEVIPIGIGKSQNSERLGELASRAPKVFLSLISSEGRIVGFEVKPEPDSDYAHCWCASLLRGLSFCHFTANIQTGANSIIIDNEIVDGGKLSWPITRMEELKNAVRKMRMGDISHYLISRRGGSNDLPYFDGFTIVNRDMVKILEPLEPG